MDDLVFALDFVCGLGEELPGGFLAQHIALFITGGELVGWV